MMRIPSAVILLLIPVVLASADATAQEMPAPGPAEPAAVISSTGVSYQIHARPKAAPKSRAKTGARAAAPAIVTVSTHESAGAPRFSLDSLTEAQLSLLEKLNRANATRLKRLDAVVVPAMWIDDELVYSPFPQTYQWAADKPKAIVVDQVAQAFAAYEYGQIVRWGPLSTGATGQTPAGLFHLSWRSRGHNSSVDPSWYLPWYFNFIPARGIAFHEYALPGGAASHGCVRLLERDAQWLFDWGEAPQRGTQGTAVLVLGCPDPSKPWRSDEFLRSGIALPDVPPTAQQACTGWTGAAAATQRRTLR